jgi:hypothetical protein
MFRPLRGAAPGYPVPALYLASAALGLALLTPCASFGCACGCGVFDVGANSLMPVDSDSGISVWFRYTFMNQNQNWEGSAKAQASDNGDKEIDTSFYTLGGSYMINHDWTLMSELPVYSRRLTTEDDGTVFGAAGTVYTGHLTDLGDLQVTGVYTGLSDDMSTGLSLGVKLPTGNYTGPNGPLGGAEFDRDSLPGTGSTDLMIGAYHEGGLNAAGSLAYFVQARYQFAVLTRESYRPGNELDGAVGVTYDFEDVGPFTKVAPLLQLIGSYRDHDSGANADPPNSGYKRLLIAPGVETRLGKLRLYADVELPIYQFTNAASSLAVEGDSGQLIASALYKLQVAYDF